MKWAVIPAASLLVVAALVPGCRKGGTTRVAGEMVQVPGGTYPMGAVDRDADARICERPRHDVTVSGFMLDRHETTVAEYREAVDAGVVPAASCPTRHPDEEALCNWGRDDRDDHPINGVSWHEARKYCEWKGKRLPTEAEFEFALRAGQHDAVYPWGDSRVPPGRFGNVVGEETQGGYPRWEHVQGYRDGFVGSSPVGSFEPSPLGLYDMSGNVWEWCGDWYGVDSYPAAAQVDPAGPEYGEHKILRGGGFHCILAELRSAERHHKPATDDSFYSGFRCAKDVE
jgi:formylglycine-generating enzyme